MKRAVTAIAGGLALLCTILLGGAGDAFAGHPLGTEDAETQGRGHAEVEFNLERQHGSDGTRTTSLGNSLALGIAPKVDLSLNYAYDFVKAEGGERSRGMGPVEATLKTVVLEGKGRIPTIGIKGGFSLPASEGEQTALLATAIGQWKLEPFEIYANAGVDVGTRLAGNDEKTTSLRGSLAAVWENQTELYLLSELLWEKQSSPSGPSTLEWLIGVKKEFNESFGIDAGIRWGLTHDSPHVTYLLGFTLEFGEEQHDAAH